MTKSWRVYQANVLPVIGHRLPNLKPSRHRSKRLHKKLIRKHAELLYGEPLVWNMPEAVRKLLEGKK